ncbi:TetR/AcrR family transcriptional regulator [Salininema proteolyticum]|uniref:TetR/AcrR family transcriptional regulator n=1 Tax=Salininema proteolyticum TaxID=1607685 RepID=A0ABV8U125_9ACTN
MPRPKTKSDGEVLDVALALIAERGPESLTFAALARESGLSAATLVQRFANKAALAQRTLLHAWDRLDDATRELDATAPPTPRGAIDLLIGLSEEHRDIEAYGNGLMLLREDVRDPVLRERGAAWEVLLTAALDRRFVSVPGAPAGVGYALAAYWQGSLTWWAFRADRPLRDFLYEKLHEFIAMLGMSDTGERDSSR